MRTLSLRVPGLQRPPVMQALSPRVLGRFHSNVCPPAPGKLGDPNMTLMTDPRMNQTLLNHFKPELILGKWGLVGEPLPFPFNPSSPLWMIHKWNETMEKYVLPKFFAEDKMPMPNLSGIERTTEVIKGTDGNDITLYIDRPKDAAAVPGLLHTHGGGMAIMSARDRLYDVYRAQLAARGFAVVSVEFRNSSGLLGHHPYPSGLNDCMSSLAWVHENKRKLGMSSLVLTGESGGGNLCTAIALRALRDGRVKEIDGVFAMCPFIGGPDLWDSKGTQSLAENDQYFVDMKGFRVCAHTYDPARLHANDPCAWPFTAKQEDLIGLPPHVISVNELDPLRDEGLKYAEMLKGAGVQVASRIVAGTPHGADMACAFVPGCEHIFEETVASLMEFSQSLVSPP